MTRYRFSSCAPRPLTACLVLVLAGMSAAGLSGCDDKPNKKPPMPKVALLPDTPPPPPPPPKQEEKKPEPKPDDRPQPQQAPKPDPTPQPQQLKMEGEAGEGAGNGPAAGSVNTDYAGQQIGGGNGAGPSVADRLAASSYANAATRALNEYLNRDQDIKRRGDYRIEVEVWIDANGQLKRSALVGSSGNPDVDEAVKAALARFPGWRNAPPENLPQPLRMKITNRMIG